MGLAPLDFFTKARFEPLDAVVLLAGAAWYAWSLRRLARQGRTWPMVRTACFAGAWLLLAVSSCSGLAAFGRQNFSAYGSIYIVLGLVAPALLAFSSPVRLALLSSGQGRGGAWLESRPARLMAGPLTTWVVFCATIFVVFFSGVARATVGGGWAAQGLYLWLLAVGWLFYWPVADVDPSPRRMGYLARILYLLLSFPVFAIMGMSLESQTGRIAPGISPASLHLGGAVIWVAGETMALVGVLWVFTQWLRADERRAAAHDRDHEQVAERQLALWRASREAAARAASS